MLTFILPDYVCIETESGKNVHVTVFIQIFNKSSFNFSLISAVSIQVQHIRKENSRRWQLEFYVVLLRLDGYGTFCR